jgi:hypothetical protein
MERTLRAVIVISALVLGHGCSPEQRSAIVGPTGLADSSYSNIGASDPRNVNFPPRNEPFLFRQNLETKYRDGLRREPTSSYVDIEGTIVWTQEYLRYRVNQCSHAEAVSRVLRQIDGFGIDAVCGSTSTATFPPRNEPFDFRLQLEQKYRDGLQRTPTATFVDVEGDIVWTQEYLRYRVNSCGHADAESKVFAQIDGQGVQPDCAVCTGPPGRPGGDERFSLGYAVRGPDLDLSWLPAAGTVTSYVIELGSVSRGTDLGIVDTGSAKTSYTLFGLRPGDYYVRVRAKNPCGIGGPSNEVVPRIR